MYNIPQVKNDKHYNYRTVDLYNREIQPNSSIPDSNLCTQFLDRRKENNNNRLSQFSFEYMGGGSKAADNIVMTGGGYKKTNKTGSINRSLISAIPNIENRMEIDNESRLPRNHNLMIGGGIDVHNNEQLNMENTRLQRGGKISEIDTSRFGILLHNPQEHTQRMMSKNTQLEARNNYKMKKY